MERFVPALYPIVLLSTKDRHLLQFELLLERLENLLTCCLVVLYLIILWIITPKYWTKNSTNTFKESTDHSSCTWLIVLTSSSCTLLAFYFSIGMIAKFQFWCLSNWMTSSRLSSNCTSSPLRRISHHPLHLLLLHSGLKLRHLLLW